MTHYTAQQRYRRAKRDPYRGAVLAPSHPMPPVVCATEGCGHARGVHDVQPFQISVPRCLVEGCPCVEYREATT